MNLENQKITGTDEIHITDSLNAALLALKIKTNENTIIPATSDLFIYVDTAPSTAPTENRKQYLFNLSNPLKYLSNTSDEFLVNIGIENNDVVIKSLVNRNIGTNDTGDYLLDEAVTETLDAYPLTLFEGENYIYTNYTNADIEIFYPKDDEFNRAYLNNAIYADHRENSNDVFSLDDIYFKDAFTKTEDKLNLEVNNADIDCLTSRNNKFSLDEDGNLIVNSITCNGIQTNVAGEVILEEESSELKINNLDALTDGGIYEFFGICYTNSSTSADIKLKINEETSGYHHSYINASGSATANGSLTSRANYIYSGTSLYEWLQTNGKLPEFPVVIEGRMYISENSDSNKKVNYTLRFYRSVNGGQSIGMYGGVFSQNFENINSLSLSLSNESIKFAKGSRLTVFNPIKGAKGDKGETGDVGPANTLTIGTVTKGEDASASITGDSPNQVLNLVLPKGDQGEQGEQGIQGNVGPANTLTIGTVTSGDEASASITGESPNQVLNLVLPKGDQGNPGGTMTVDDVEEMIESKMGIMYPVGSIYMSVNDTNPSTLFGGTWEQIKDRFLLASGDDYVAGVTGGHAGLQAHTHAIPTLTGTAQSSGDHTHVISRRTSTYGSGVQTNWRCITAPDSVNGDYDQVSNTESAGAHTHTVTIASSNTDSTGNGDGGNMPPYLTVYMWKRIS